MSRSDIKLVVQCDDFGMCHAGNLGAVQAFTEGILTQASVMVPCPWFREAVRLAKEHSLPTGVHLTSTAEWEFMRWGPLTGGRTIVGDDGRLPRTVEYVRDNADPDELFEEFVAQTELYVAEGLEIGYFDCHMGIAIPPVYEKICKKYNKPFDYPLAEVGVGFDSIHMLSGRPSDEKVDYLIDRISNMEAGKHLIVSHCAVESEELRSLTADRPNQPDHLLWANEYRPSDLAALTSPDVKKLVADRGIDLVPVAAL